MNLKTVCLSIMLCITICPEVTKGSCKPTEDLSGQTQNNDKNSYTDTFDVQKAGKMVKDFYVNYTTSLLLPIHLSSELCDSLVNESLTQRLIEKTSRMTRATNSNPIIRAQDFAKDVIQTINVRHLDGKWFMLEYNWSGVITEIPVRVNRINGRYMIDYITPPWNDSLYGDNLFFDNPVPQAIDASTPLSLLETFYAAYTMEYCSMPEDLRTRLGALRLKHLTPNALLRLKAMEDEYKLDGLPGYDLLIDNFDFDRLWLPNIQFIMSTEDTYIMNTTLGTTIEIKVVKQGDEYRIDDIVKK